MVSILQGGPHDWRVLVDVPRRSEGLATPGPWDLLGPLGTLDIAGHRWKSPREEGFNMRETAAIGFFGSKAWRVVKHTPTFRCEELKTS